MSHRIIQGLRWARPAARPRNIPLQRRRKGAKAIGLRYEAALAAALPLAKHGQWFEFYDSNGPGYCQTDLLLEVQGRLFVLEAKLTDVPGGRAQLEELYLPVVALAHQRQAHGIVVSRSARAERSKSLLRYDLPAAIAAASLGLVPSLLWLGHAPLGLGPRPTFGGGLRPTA